MTQAHDYTLTGQDIDDICAGLEMRLCIIETGTIHLRGKEISENRRKMLSPEQFKLIERTDSLIARLQGA